MTMIARRYRQTDTRKDREHLCSNTAVCTTCIMR